MPTILDSNIILDLLYPESDWFEWSQQWYLRRAAEAPVVINSVIFSEAFASIREPHDAVSAMEAFGLSFEAISPEASHRAGRAQADYRRRGGARNRTLADFLVGGHAATRGHAILTRDQNRYRTYFPSVSIIAPDTHP